MGIELGSDRDGGLALTDLARREGPGPTRCRVVVGIAGIAFHQEVLDLLGRDPRLEVVGSVSHGDRLGAALAGRGADALVLCPTFAAALAALLPEDRPAVLMAAEEMTVPVLRLAIDVGAHGAFLWPEERAELLEVVARTRRPDQGQRGVRGRVVAILGARGGAGVTFIASHVVASLARRGTSAALVDMDPRFSDLTAALGVGADGPVPSIGDLLPVLDELSPEHVERALYPHHEGFAVLLRRGSASDETGAPALDRAVPVGLYAACVALLAGDHDVVAIHVGRSSETFARAAIELADVVVLVAGLDLLSLYGARRMLGSLLLRGSDGLRVVANQTRRSDLSVSDAARILQEPIAATIRFDSAVPVAQDLARLVPRRARRLWRDVGKVTSLIMPAQVPDGRQEPAPAPRGRKRDASGSRGLRSTDARANGAPTALDGRKDG